MTERSDIEPNNRRWRRLSDTCRCGWVDWGHALPGSAVQLKHQIDSEQSGSTRLNRMNITFGGLSSLYIGIRSRNGSWTDTCIHYQTLGGQKEPFATTA